MLGELLGAVFDGVIAPQVEPKSRAGIAVLYLAFSLLVIVLVYFVWFHGDA